MMDKKVFDDCYETYMNSKPGEPFWEELAEKHGEKSKDALRKKFNRQMKKKSLPSREDSIGDTVSVETKGNEDGSEVSHVKLKVSSREDNDLLQRIIDTKMKSPKMVLELHGYDPEVWVIKTVLSNAWHMMKSHKSGGGRQMLLQSKILVAPKDNGKITREYIDEWFSENVNKAPIFKKSKSKVSKDGLTFELCLADTHIGKIGAHDKDGISNIIPELKLCLEDMFYQIEKTEIKKIIIASMGDTFNADTKQKTTTRGTHVGNDGRSPQENFDIAIDLHRWAIDMFGELSPVEFLFVPGNHDALQSYFLAKSLELYYHNSNRVVVDAGHEPRKHRLIGKNLIGWLHGNENNKRIMTNFLQLDARESWSKARWREVHGGHLHKQSLLEEGGVTFRRVPSTSPTDIWHNEMLFIGATRSITGFLWDDNMGLRSQLYSNIYWD